MKHKKKIHCIAIIIVIIFILGVAGGLAASASMPPKNDISAVRQPKLIVQLGHSQIVYNTAFTGDGKFLVTSSIGRSIKLWDVGSGREIEDLRTDIGTIVSLSFVRDSYRLICASIDGKLLIWNIETGKTVIISSEKVENISTMALSRDGNFALTMDLNSVLSYWNIKKPGLLRTFNIRPENQPWGKNPLLFKPIIGRMSFRMTFSMDGDFAIIGMLDESIRFLNLKNDRGLRIFKSFYSPDEYFSFSKDSKQLFIIDFNGLRDTLPIDEKSPIWNNSRYTVDHILNQKPDGHPPKNFLEEKFSIRKDRPENLSGFIYSEEKGLVLRFYRSGRWQFLDSISGIRLRTPQPPDEKIIPIAFVPKQFHLLCNKEDGNLVMVDILSGNIIRRFERQSMPCTGVRLNHDTSRITIEGKENQMINKFIALTSQDPSLPEIEQKFPLSSSWHSVWDFSTGHQVAFQRDLNSNTKLTARPPLRKFYDALQQIKYKHEFPTMVHKLRNFLENRQDLEKVEQAKLLWQRGESSAAWRKIAESLHRHMVPELKKAFDDIELSYERTKAFFASWAHANSMTGQGYAAFSKDNLTLAIAKSKEIDLIRFKKAFSIVLSKITYEDFKDENKVIQLFSRAVPSVLSKLEGHNNDVHTIAFSKNNDVLLSVAEGGEIKLWDVEAVREIDSWNAAVNHPVKQTIFSAGEQFILLILDDGTLIGFQKNEKKQVFRTKVNPFQVAKANSFDYSIDKKMLIFGFPDGRSKLFDPRTGKEYGSLFSFIDGTWAIVNPEGRFDTNNLEDIKGLHWIMPDDHLKPLPLEIFMRDYYEPKLLPRILAGETLPSIRPLMQLNRVQPLVEIKEIISQPGNPGRVTVKVKVEKNKGTYGGLQRETGVYDLRLFRDRQLVGYTPGVEKEIAVDPVKGAGTISFSNIKLPAGVGQQEVEFSAYAFNVDRVKSKTHRKTYTFSRTMTPVKGNAYLVVAGVNAYENPSMDLKFAANDARLISRTLAKKLRKTGQYKDIVVVPLISDSQTRQGKRVVTEKSATKSHFKAILDLLAGRKVDNRIVKTIPNANRIHEANPEDLVFISFSSHGDTDDQGNFYLFPYDSGNQKREGEQAKPEWFKRCISGTELSQWLKDVDAGDMVMVVDACYSASAVQSKGFKPGPMGSRGLGQLAYNKGMRILAATQADNIALESNRLEHGLLTYALLIDGIENGKADFNPQDNTLTMGEWLKYGVKRVPELYTPASEFKGVQLIVRKYRLQQPSLFDFTRDKPEIILYSNIERK